MDSSPQSWGARGARITESVGAVCISSLYPESQIQRCTPPPKATQGGQDAFCHMTYVPNIRGTYQIQYKPGILGLDEPPKLWFDQ